jgi:hypothetical protein
VAFETASHAHHGSETASHMDMDHAIMSSADSNADSNASNDSSSGTGNGDGDGDGGSEWRFFATAGDGNGSIGTNGSLGTNGHIGTGYPSKWRDLWPLTVVGGSAQRQRKVR